jgi:murein L,D-transpeptidase YcbB/YkuD
MAKDLKNGRSNTRENAVADSLRVVNLTDSLSILSVEAVLQAQEPIFDEYKNLKIALNNILDSVASDSQSLLLNGITRDSSQVFQIVQAIEVNLERWRMESASLDGTYAWVNIPAYMMYVIENDKIALESRVIVGKRGNETPRFSSDIECFTVFPYWYVPRKISVQEYLPTIRKDTTFLSRNNFDVLDRSGKIQDHSLIDWKKLTPNNFPYTLRQREGKENSLGVLKFVFDNPYAVFVHDTNAKRLFKNKMRALSHGCIRMEKAYEFAHYLVSERSKITNETLDRYLKTEKKATVSLIPSVPIHIRYFTCEVRNEKLMLYEDIYREDRKLILKLYGDEEVY